MAKNAMMEMRTRATGVHRYVRMNAVIGIAEIVTMALRGIVKGHHRLIYARKVQSQYLFASAVISVQINVLVLDLDPEAVPEVVRGVVPEAVPAVVRVVVPEAVRVVVPEAVLEAVPVVVREAGRAVVPVAVPVRAPEHPVSIVGIVSTETFVTERKPVKAESASAPRAP